MRGLTESAGLKQIPQTCFLGLTPPHHFFLHLHPWFILSSISLVHLHPWFILSSISPFNFQVGVYHLSPTFPNDITSVSAQGSTSSPRDITFSIRTKFHEWVAPSYYINIRPKFNDSHQHPHKVQWLGYPPVGHCPTQIRWHGDSIVSISWPHIVLQASWRPIRPSPSIAYSSKLHNRSIRPSPSTAYTHPRLSNRSNCFYCYWVVWSTQSSHHLGALERSFFGTREVIFWPLGCKSFGNKRCIFVALLISSFYRSKNVFLNV